MKGKGFLIKTSIKLSAIASIILFLNHQIANADPVVPPDAAAAIKSVIPGSTEPGVISNTLSAQPITPTKRRAAAVAAPEEKAGGLGPQAAQIKFKLTQIYLEGNQTYTEAQLRPIYADKLGKVISVADLEGIVQGITNYYRNNGYILTRAILPPQHVANGIVHIRVLEGYIAHAKVQGDPKRAKCLLQCYGNQIAKSRPTQVRVMEHYLRLANEIPGMTARAVLEPSKTNTGASDMDLVATQKTFSGYLSYDNYGTRYIGPNQATLNMNFNSVFQSGDSTHFTTVRTSRPLELQYVDLSHDFPLGCSGLRGAIDGNSSRTRPGLNLRQLKIDGDAVNINGTLTYPVLRSRDHDLTVDGGFYYIDSAVNAFDQTLYNDHLRTLRGGFSFDSTDRYYGSNTINAHLEQGLEILGASSDPTSPFTSRFGADGHFTKVSASIGRLQQIWGALSTFVYTTGQYSWSPLLATEQFAYGGSQLGRGYDPAEIIGDRGWAGSVELRYDLAHTVLALPASFEPYLFYDAGIIWNMKDVPGTKLKQSATSYGFGVRFSFSRYFSGNLMFAQPLTKQVAAETFVGQGRKPRTFFSLVASV